MLGKFKSAPIILIALGAVFLLNNFGILPWSVWNNLWKFWPILLILIGVEYLIGHSISIRTIIILFVLVFLVPVVFAINPFTNNPLSTDKLAVSEDLGTLTKAKLIIDMPATNLVIKTASNNSKLVAGIIAYSKAANKPKLETEESFGQKIVKITQENIPGLPFISSLRNDTQLGLTAQIPLELQITTQASKENIDLNDLRVDYLEINSKASDITINFGTTYSSQVKINSSASNLTIKIPKEMEARMKINSKVKNVSIDNRFAQNNNTYKTKNFDKAFTRLDIQIEAIAGSITVK